MKPPCKDCSKRVLGCHATCKEYKAYKDISLDNYYRAKKYLYHEHNADAVEIANAIRAKKKRRGI